MYKITITKTELKTEEELKAEDTLARRSGRAPWDMAVPPDFDPKVKIVKFLETVLTEEEWARAKKAIIAEA